MLLSGRHTGSRGTLCWQRSGPCTTWLLSDGFLNMVELVRPSCLSCWHSNRQVPSMRQGEKLCCSPGSSWRSVGRLTLNGQYFLCSWAILRRSETSGVSWCDSAGSARGWIQVSVLPATIAHPIILKGSVCAKDRDYSCRRNRNPVLVPMGCRSPLGVLSDQPGIRAQDVHPTFAGSVRGGQEPRHRVLQDDQCERHRYQRGHRSSFSLCVLMQRRAVADCRKRSDRAHRKRHGQRRPARSRSEGFQRGNGVAVRAGRSPT